MSELTIPLRVLLQKGIIFKWDFPQEDTFNKIQLSSLPVLKFYDVNKDVALSVVASTKGFRAVQMQEDQPVANALFSSLSKRCRKSRVGRA